MKHAMIVATAAALLWGLAGCGSGSGTDPATAPIAARSPSATSTLAPTAAPTELSPPNTSVADGEANIALICLSHVGVQEATQAVVASVDHLLQTAADTPPDTLVLGVCRGFV